MCGYEFTKTQNIIKFKLEAVKSTNQISLISTYRLLNITRPFSTYNNCEAALLERAFPNLSFGYDPVSIGRIITYVLFQLPIEKGIGPSVETWPLYILRYITYEMGLAERRRGRGDAAADRAGASHPPGACGRARGAERGALRARRPIAKFNAKVMRARLRLRAAMQERPADRGEPQCLTGNRDTHTRPSHITSIFTRCRAVLNKKQFRD